MKNLDYITNWDPHNLLQYMEKHEIISCTVGGLIRHFYKEKYFYNCADTHLTELFTTLLKNGYVTVKYHSEGRKTVSIYKRILRLGKLV